MSQLDPTFANPDYLNLKKIQQRKKVYNKVQGHSKAFDTLDTSLEFIHQLHEEDSDVLKEVKDLQCSLFKPRKWQRCKLIY
jgi:hypothetical protein